MLLSACFCQQAATMSTYKFTLRAVASPDAPQNPLVRKRARSGGENWVQVTRRPDSRAKKPRTGGSQQPACTHKDHQILSTGEAAAFAAQFSDKKTHATKASQHEFLATCIDVDLEQNVKHAGRQKYTRKRGHKTTYFVPYCGSRCEICKTQFLHYFRISRKVVQSVAKAKAAAAVATPLSPMKSPQKKGADSARRTSAIKAKFENFLQALPQAENRFSDAARPSTDMVHLAPVGGRRASPYNVWIHWLQKEEADQFAKRGKADFKPQILLKTAQRTMKTFKLGYQAPMKDTCAECELYNLQIRTAPPALKVVVLCFCSGAFFGFPNCVALFVCPFSGQTSPRAGHAFTVGQRRIRPQQVPRTVQHADLGWSNSDDFSNSGGSFP